MSHVTNIQLDRVDNISVLHFCQEYIEQLRPIVVTGGISHWPAITRWTDSYLIDAAGDLSLRVSPKADYVDGESMREVEAEGDYTLKAVLELMNGDHSSELCYARESDLLSRCPTLKKDIIPPIYLAATAPHAHPRTGSLDPKIWLGPANTIAQLHWDPEHNLFTQVRGRKRVILVPPEDAPLASPIVFSIESLVGKPFFVKHETLLDALVRCVSDVASLDPAVRIAFFRNLLAKNLTPEELSLLCDFLLDVNNCHVNAESPNLMANPSFAEARRFETILEPGDLLFIPYFWHHLVHSLEPSISINWFFLQEGLTKSVTSEWPVDILLAHLIP